MNRSERQNLGWELERKYFDVSNDIVDTVKNLWWNLTEPFEYTMDYGGSEETLGTAIDWDLLIKKAPNVYNRLYKVVEHASQYPEQLANIRAPPGSP